MTSRLKKYFHTFFSNNTEKILRLERSFFNSSRLHDSSRFTLDSPVAPDNDYAALPIQGRKCRLILNIQSIYGCVKNSP